MLIQEAYILVKEIGFSYSDVQKLTRCERLAFLNIKAEEDQREIDELKRNNPS
jgi:hypothetical protein